MHRIGLWVLVATQPANVCARISKIRQPAMKCARRADEDHRIPRDQMYLQMLCDSYHKNMNLLCQGDSI